MYAEFALFSGPVRRLVPELAAWREATIFETEGTSCIFFRTIDDVIRIQCDSNGSVVSSSARFGREVFHKMISRAVGHFDIYENGGEGHGYKSIESTLFARRTCCRALHSHPYA